MCSFIPVLSSYIFLYEWMLTQPPRRPPLLLQCKNINVTPAVLFICCFLILHRLWRSCSTECDTIEWFLVMKLEVNERNKSWAVLSFFSSINLEWLRKKIKINLDKPAVIRIWNFLNCYSCAIQLDMKFISLLATFYCKTQVEICLASDNSDAAKS
jgi:hypothetical protein